MTACGENENKKMKEEEEEEAREYYGQLTIWIGNWNYSQWVYRL